MYDRPGGRIVLNRTVVVDNLCGSHLQSQSELITSIVTVKKFSIVSQIVNHFSFVSFMSIL